MVEVVRERRKGRGTGLRVRPSNPTTRYSMKLYRVPGESPKQKFYRGLEEMERWRRYYQGKGIRTRRVEI